ncbi:cytochrome P450 [Streptosporangium sp. CA-115845]|uniref:cytochrome P450 n=1 Tax=Streptosporangium sp. CA-115845 TaxID=3240071 RepID=UPI003D939943
MLTAPYDYYRLLRDAGPVVRLSKYDVLGVARYDDVKTTMRDHETFKSSAGPGFNDAYNQKMQGTVVASEPPQHTEIRATMVRRLRLARLKDMQPVADDLARKLITQFLERGEFDAAKDLARPFVGTFVASVLGVSTEIAEQAIDGSTAGFNQTGPLNERTLAATPVIESLFAMMQQLTKADLVPDSIAWDILDSHERGELPFASSLSLIFNFLGPAFDTTISAMGFAAWLLATNPEQWKLLRENPELIPAVINESIRIESPLQIWSRYCPDGAVIDGVEIPANTRVAVFPGSANRDERHYANPETFDIRRNPVDQLGFGQGIHTCVGAPLARMELTSVLSAMTELIHTLEPAGEPVLQLNNTTRGFASAPVSVS